MTTQSHTHKEDEALQVVTDADIDRALNTSIPGGSTADAWFLPHPYEKGNANVRDVVKRMLESFAASRPVAVEGSSPEPTPFAYALVLRQRDEPALMDKAACLSFDKEAWQSYFEYNSSPADAIFGPTVRPLYLHPPAASTTKAGGAS